MSNEQAKVRQDIYFGRAGIERLQRLVQDEGVDASTLVRDVLAKYEQEKVSFMHLVSTAVFQLAKTLEATSIEDLASDTPQSELINSVRQKLASLLGSRFAALGIEDALREMLHLPARPWGVRPGLIPINRTRLHLVSLVEHFVAYLLKHSPELVKVTVSLRQAHEDEGLNTRAVLEPALRFPNGALAVAFERQYVVVDEQEQATKWYALAYLAEEFDKSWQRFLLQPEPDEVPE